MAAKYMSCIEKIWGKNKLLRKLAEMGVKNLGSLNGLTLTSATYRKALKP